MESLIVSIFKQKGGDMECGNYRGMKLSDHSLKVFERVLDGDCKYWETSFWIHDGERDCGCHLCSKSATGKELVMAVSSEDIRNEEFWGLLYADDLVITTENEEDLQRRVVEWQETLERGGLRVHVDETEGMVSSKKCKDWTAICESRCSQL
ncbi:uncharacterized protein [Palaemon carinicauda]|uniref:uncharacterized protein n=1 Tax=Palaemon carinicauda TaxID=392227 RepID=UPI0035B5FF3C